MKAILEKMKSDTDMSLSNVSESNFNQDVIDAIDNSFSTIVSSAIPQKTENSNVVFLKKQDLTNTNSQFGEIINEFALLKDIEQENIQITRETAENLKRTKVENSLENRNKSSTGIAFISEYLPKFAEKIDELNTKIDNLEIDQSNSNRMMPNTAKSKRFLTKKSVLTGVAALGTVGVIGGLTSSKGVRNAAGDIFGSIGNFTNSIAESMGIPMSGASSEYTPATIPSGSESWKSDTQFISEVNRVSKKYNIDANDLLGVIHSESQMNPAAKNPAGSATGLIQFIETTAAGLGTSTKDLRQMTRAQQMKYVDAYFSSVRLPKGANAGQIYASIFYPAMMRSGVGPRIGSKEYAQNRGLDIDRDGRITTSDLTVRISKKRQEIGLGASRSAGTYTEANQAAISASGGGGGQGGPPPPTGSRGSLKALVGRVVDISNSPTSTMASLNNLDPTFENQVVGAVTEYNRITGRKAMITSAFRTRADQKRILESGGGMMPARGISRHERGLAIDFNSADVNMMARMGILQRHGLHQRYGAKDPVHVEQIGKGSGGNVEYYQIAGEDGNNARATMLANELTKLSDLISGRATTNTLAPPNTNNRISDLSKASQLRRMTNNRGQNTVVVNQSSAQPVVTPGRGSSPSPKNQNNAKQYQAHFGTN